MTICEELRQAVLHAAIQGKLTEQREEDGTVEDLLEKIREEKEKLIAEGKIKKEKKLPEIDEVPFDIPENWKWVHVGDVNINIQYGSASKSSSSGTIAVLRMGNIQSGHIVYDNLVFTSDEKEIAKYPLKKGDLLFNRTNSKELVGKVGIYNAEIPAIYAGYLVRLTPLIIVSDYMNYVFQTNYYWDYCQRVRSDAIGQSNINAEKLKNFIFPLPPVAEQHRIVERVNTLMEKIDVLQSIEDELQSLKQAFPGNMRDAILQAAMQGKLTEQLESDGTAEELLEEIKQEKEKLIKEGKIKREKKLPEISEDEIPFDIPENWKWVRLGNIVSVFGGKRIPAGRKLTKTNTGHIYIRVSDMKNDYVMNDDLMYVPEDIFPSISRYIIYSEDIYITVAGTIGRIGRIPPELDGANLTENADRLVFQLVDQLWLMQCLKSIVVQSQIIEATTKVGQPKLAIRRIQDMVIPLPPLAEQHRIIARLNELLPLCDTLEEAK